MGKTGVNQKQFRKMTEAPVRPLILKLAIPTTVSMLVTGIYNTADTYFVSQYGEYISAQVLANSLTLVDKVESPTELDFEDYKININIKR